MTYKEKYAELFSTYENATKALHEATQKISFTNGFGDINDLGNYQKAHKEYRTAERNFRDLLKYVTSKSLNPDAEFVSQEYMYNIIKEDQQMRGTPWKDEDVRPSTEAGLKGYECRIGLTNDGEISRMIQGTEYKFPVIDLNHGKECYDYLVKMLQGDAEFNINNIKLDKIDEKKQIYIRVEITVWK